MSSKDNGVKSTLKFRKNTEITIKSTIAVQFPFLGFHTSDESLFLSLPCLSVYHSVCSRKLCKLET